MPVTRFLAPQTARISQSPISDATRQRPSRRGLRSTAARPKNAALIDMMPIVGRSVSKNSTTFSEPAAIARVRFNSDVALRIRVAQSTPLVGFEFWMTESSTERGLRHVNGEREVVRSSVLAEHATDLVIKSGDFCVS